MEKGKQRVSQADDSAALEYRKLVLIFVPFIVFFAMAMCFLCDTPRVNREYNRSVQQILLPFNSTDPFASRDANIQTPPVWMIPHTECNPTPKSFPATQPQVSSCAEVYSMFSSGHMPFRLLMSNCVCMPASVPSLRWLAAGHQASTPNNERNVP